MLGITLNVPAIQHAQVHRAVLLRVIQRCDAGMQGVIDWPAILPFICSNAIWQFHVPVGNASAPHPRRIAPRFPLDIVATTAIKRGSSVHAHLAKVLIHTLTTDADTEEHPQGRLTALQGLAQLATLFEHFFHASNTGPYATHLPSSLFAWQSSHSPALF